VATDWVLPQRAGEFFVAIAISSESACGEPLGLCLKLGYQAGFECGVPQLLGPATCLSRPGGKPVSQLRSFLLQIGGGDGAIDDAGTLGVRGAGGSPSNFRTAPWRVLRCLPLSQRLSAAGSASSMAVSSAFNASSQLSVTAAIPSFMSISTRS
jgi:hypothetical protein